MFLIINHFYRLPVFSVGYARVTHGGLTDTEIQMAKFRVRSDANEKDNLVVVTDSSLIKDSSVHFNSK